MPDFDWDGLQAIVDRQAVSGPTADYLAGIYKATLMLNDAAQIWTEFDYENQLLEILADIVQDSIVDGSLVVVPPAGHGSRDYEDSRKPIQDGTL